MAVMQESPVHDRPCAISQSMPTGRDAQWLRPRDWWNSSPNPTFSGKRSSGHPYRCEYRRQGVLEAGARRSRTSLRACAAAGVMQRDAHLLSFFGPRYDKKAAPNRAAESDREEVKVNLLVHMDARGTLSVYPHLGIRATLFYEMALPWLRGATYLDDCLGPGHCFGLDYAARRSPLLR